MDGAPRPVEGVSPGWLAIMARPRGGDWLSDELRALRRAGVDVLVSLLSRAEVLELELEREPEACAAAGIRFESLPIEDMDVPPSRELALALAEKLAADVRAGRGVLVHCRAGIGRSAVIAACVLVVLGMTAAQACARLSEARGRIVPETRRQSRFVAEVAEWRSSKKAE